MPSDSFQPVSKVYASYQASATLQWFPEICRLVPTSLVSVGRTLQIPDDLWQQREDPRRLAYASDKVARDNALKLTLKQLVNLTVTYGEALICRCSLGDQIVLSVQPGIEE